MFCMLDSRLHNEGSHVESYGIHKRKSLCLLAMAREIYCTYRSTNLVPDRQRNALESQIYDLSFYYLMLLREKIAYFPDFEVC